MNSYKNIITVFKLTTRIGRKPFGIDESKEYDNLNDVDQAITWFEQVWEDGEQWIVSYFSHYDIDNMPVWHVLDKATNE